MTSRIPRSFRSHLQRRPGRGHVQWRAATARRARLPIAGRQDQRDPAAAAQWWKGGKSTKVGGNGEEMIDVFVDVSLLFFPFMSKSIESQVLMRIRFVQKFSWKHG